MTTRRKFGLGIAAIIAAGRAPAAIVRSMLGARNAILAGGGGVPLPYDAEVEWLESTGTQWIDTGIKCAADVGIKIVGEMFEITYDVFPAMIGAQNDTETMYFGVYEDSGIVYVGGVNEVQLGINTKFIAEVNYLNNEITKASFYQSTVQSSLVTHDINANICVFGMGKETVPISCLSKSRVYEVVISKGNQEVMWLKPVRKGSTGFFFDTITGHTLGISGTGTLVVGQDK